MHVTRTFSFQVFVDDVTAAERWYSDLPGIEPYFRSEDVGVPAGYVGFRVSDYPSELGVTDRKLAPNGLGTGPAGSVTYWQVDEVPAAFDRLLSLGAKPPQPPTELSSGFMIASVMDPFGNIVGLRFDPSFLKDPGSAERSAYERRVSTSARRWPFRRGQQARRSTIFLCSSCAET
jgi:predicted enzyme related to lactoylglutathione lyase